MAIDNSGKFIEFKKFTDKYFYHTPTNLEDEMKKQSYLSDDSIYGLIHLNTSSLGIFDYEEFKKDSLKFSKSAYREQRFKDLLD